jgi:hypothetical protein
MSTKKLAPAPGAKAPTALWLNLTMIAVLARFLFEGTHVSIAGLQMNWGTLDPLLVAAVVGVPAALYGYRRATDARHGKVE